MKTMWGKTAAASLAALLFTVPSAVSAESVSRQQLQVENRDMASIRVIEQSDQTSVSVRDVAALFGGQIFTDHQDGYLIMVNSVHYVLLHANSTEAVINGTSVSLSQAPIIHSGMLVADLNELAVLFGGDVMQDAQGNLVLTLQTLLDAESVDMKWIDKNHLLVSMLTDEGTENFKLNVHTREFEQITKSLDAAEIAVSANGAWAAYTNELGEIHLVNLNTLETRLLTKDDSAKVELQFNREGDKIYFLQGSNSETISYINIADGKITKVVDDKVNYKSDLSISANEKNMLYAVSKAGVITAAADGSDVTDINSANTEPQLYTYEVKMFGKASALTASKDNKTYAHLLADGSVVYVSGVTEDAEALSALKWVGSDKSEKTLAPELDVLQLEIDYKGEPVVLAYGKDGTKGIYSVNPVTGTAVLQRSVEDTVESIALSRDGKKISALMSTEEGEKIVLLAKSGSMDLTK